MTALTACGWAAFGLHHHSSTVGLVVFAAFLPSFVITPFAGVLADRHDRRTMLLVMNAIGLLSTLGLAWSGMGGTPERRAAGRGLFCPRRISLVEHTDPAGDARKPRPRARSAQRRLPSPGEPERRAAPGAAAGRAVAARRAVAPAPSSSPARSTRWASRRSGSSARRRTSAAAPDESALVQLAQGIRYVLRAPVVCSVIALALLRLCPCDGL